MFLLLINNAFASNLEIRPGFGDYAVLLRKESPNMEHQATTQYSVLDYLCMLEFAMEKQTETYFAPSLI